MHWPRSTDYHESIQNLHATVSDGELRGGVPATTPMGLPLPYAGNFADVYKVHCPGTGNTWAVKCFTRGPDTLKDRYRRISEHLQKAKLPFTVDFQFIEPGIRVREQWFPFLKMRWVEGLSLNRFVVDYLNKSATLRLLLPIWLKLSRLLRKAKVAHADLQHGNVLLVPSPQRERFSLKLVDYDGMFVPSLAGQDSGELGHPSYQHPERLRLGTYNVEVDRFSHLTIYCALHTLTTHGELWNRFDNQDNLLFKEADFRNPANSLLFQDLWASRDPTVRTLAGHLILAVHAPLDQLPLLEQLVDAGIVRSLTLDQQREVGRLMGDGGSTLSGAPELVDHGAWWDPAQDFAEVPGLTAPRPAAPHFAPPQSLDPSSSTPDGWLSPETLLNMPVGSTEPLGPREGATPVTKAKPQATHLPVETNILGMKMVLIPAGRFLMGSPARDDAAANDEKPQHQVQITRPFYLASHPVTVGQFGQFVAETGYKMGDSCWRNAFRGQSARHPVVDVHWNDASAFCLWLSQKEGSQYRLPTEAEWEYACRAGSSDLFCFGDDEDELIAYAWYKRNSNNTTHEVGRMQPNRWGLYDMHGNVWEWCADWHGRSSYVASVNVDPPGPSSGHTRVLRGGAWNCWRKNLRCASRANRPPNERDNTVGFRAVIPPG